MQKARGTPRAFAFVGIALRRISGRAGSCHTLECAPDPQNALSEFDLKPERILGAAEGRAHGFYTTNRCVMFGQPCPCRERVVCALLTK